MSVINEKQAEEAVALAAGRAGPPPLSFPGRYYSKTKTVCIIELPCVYAMSYEQHQYPSQILNIDLPDRLQVH